MTEPIRAPEPTPEPVVGALERVAQRLEQPGVGAAEMSSATPVDVAALPYTATTIAPATRPVVVEKSPLREDIEEALADDKLRRIYATLTPGVQAAFRNAAEALAARLEQMIVIGKLDLRAAHQAIGRWLTMIPRTNPWFLLQEAKVKTDAVLALATRARGK